ncbi:uncharacterized protein LOC126830530 [Patella vulgata]|uniref:uncharacterized protein LOC126830530 n=1 Tax=Patella vulgata TaxID=6465 RepID=UPI0024A85FFD|nr:uncharacterized protein LOC126830530 [Patella vulgata]
MKSTKITSYKDPPNLPLIPKITTSCVGTMNEDIPLNVKLMTLRSRSFPTMSNFKQPKQTGKYSRPTAFPVARGIEDSSKSGSTEVNVRPKSKVKKRRKPGHGMNFWFSKRDKRRRTRSAVSNGLATDLCLTNLNMKNELSDHTLSKVPRKRDLALNPPVHQTPSNSAGQVKTKKTRKKRNRSRNKARVATNENLISRRCTRSMSQPHTCTIETLEKETLMQCVNREDKKRQRHNQLNARRNQEKGKRRRRNKQQYDMNSQCQGKASDINKGQPLQNAGTMKNIDQTIVAEGETKMRTRSGTKQLPDSLTDKFDQQLIGNLIFDCHLCSRQFFRRSHLESHMKFRHGQEYPA